ncbi:iron-containing alcohol dehydrogenase [Priestia megaterium]|uniref:iron-containing alcohol dehydrogenase n=1 Tax=Priestia megaterium TaxID=1404 RepID=UPI0025A4CA01|nr:iron-containing alcohol dehydrogenase [Priestia megaterium]MDM8150094.1 iron-containing alcohol dehydrogenase [Priestia megaterium]
MNFSFSIPTKIEFGSGICTQVGEILKPYVDKKVLIVSDCGVRQAGILKNVEESLRNFKISYEIFDKVEANPSTQILEQGIEYLGMHQCDAVLGVGGGSSIDTAKGIAAMATNTGSILDYEGINKIKNKPLPILAIPTTSGTGAEVTASAVFTNKDTLFKTVIMSNYLFPKVAILDPLLTLKLPSSITAATGMDALTHAIESYISKNSNFLSKSLAIEAIKLIGESLLQAYYVGTDVSSREKMLVASMMAGMAFSQSRLGNVHAISHTFGGIFNIPHGIANATLLPYVMDFNLFACPSEMKDIAVALGADVFGLTLEKAAEQAILEVIKINSAIGIPKTIKELGVNLELLPQMIDDSMRSPNTISNPRITTSKDIKQIIESAYHGYFPTKDFIEKGREYNVLRNENVYN